MSKRVAFHEAGHACVAADLGFNVELVSLTERKVLFSPNPKRLLEHNEKLSPSGEEALQNDIVVSVAGPFSQHWLQSEEPFHGTSLTALGGGQAETGEGDEGRIRLAVARLQRVKLINGISDDPGFYEAEAGFIRGAKDHLQDWLRTHRLPAWFDVLQRHWRVRERWTAGLFCGLFGAIRATVSPFFERERRPIGEVGQ